MKYIFIHIGKTAGTSLRTFLTKNINKSYHAYGRIHSSSLDSPDFRLSQNILEHNLFSAHFKYGLHRYIDDDYQYITMLREPVDRFLSAHRYAIDRKWISNKVGPIEYLNKQQDHVRYQMNMVSGLEESEGVSSMYNTALDNLLSDKFLFGFTDSYNEFIDLCCEIKNWKPEYRRYNPTRAKVSVDDGTIDELKILLHDEIVFYNDAKKIYEDKYSDVLRKIRK